MAIAFTLITLAFGPVVGRNPHSLHDRARGPSIGTDGSNPALSSAESAANLTPGRHGGDAASEEIVWARRRAESHVKPRRVRTELTESAELEVRIHLPPPESPLRTDFVRGWSRTAKVERLRQRDASGISEVTHTSTAEMCSAIQSSAASTLSPTRTMLTFEVPGSVASRWRQRKH